MSKEAIEALEAARAHILDAYRIWQADDVSAVPPPKSGAGSVIAKIDAVLSLPIAVEGKAEPAQPDYGYMRVVEVFDRNVTAGAFLSEDGEGGFAAGVSRMADEIDRLRAALSSSPGKDGGQEVGSTHEERIALAAALTWDVNNITPDEVREIINRLAAEGFRLQRVGGQEVEAVAEWTYQIQYGPEGEADYAWVYRAQEMVATMKTHHARALCSALSAPQTASTAQEMGAEAARDVLAERERQKTAEGWTTTHDDNHTYGEMARAAAVYALASTVDMGHEAAAALSFWPWDQEWFKPTDERRSLVKAGALILAEIERLDRAALETSKEGAQ